MRVFDCVHRCFVPLWIVFIVAVAAGSKTLAADDDTGKNSNNTPAQPAPRIDAPAPLTERERYLLEQVEELKKRVADLEALVKPSATPAHSAAEPAVQPGSVQPGSTTTATTGQPGSHDVFSSSASSNNVGQADSATSQTAQSGLPKEESWQPFSYADWTWLNGNARTKDAVWDSKYFTPEFRVDTHFMKDYNQPKDHTMGGSTESFRSGEVQLEQLSFGGDLHVGNVRARILTMYGLFATTTPRNDASAGVGQWNLNDAYRYFSEAWGGYHFNVNHGLNIDAGIFVSYIGLFSYYNFDNWAYQPSFVSSNTPWFFNGVRIQWFPTDKLKIEPWIINGWQSYAKFNGHPGLGGQILYRPKPWLSMVFNNYGMGTDTLGVPGRSRIHTDDSVEVRYYNQPEKSGLDKMAFSLTGDLGCEYGGSAPGTVVSCHSNSNGHPKQSFAGWMLYNRWWFDRDKYAFTLGGGQMDNPGRYLTLLPPINGATAVSGSRTSLDIRAAPSKRGIPPPLSIGCHLNTSPFGLRPDTAMRMCRTGRAVKELLHQVGMSPPLPRTEWSERPPVTFARMDRLPLSHRCHFQATRGKGWRLITLPVRLRPLARA